MLDIHAQTSDSSSHAKFGNFPALRGDYRYGGFELSVLPKRSLLKAIALTGLVLVGMCTVCYLFLLGAQVYSVLQVSRVLDRVERLRAGDSYTDYRSVIRGCKTSESTSSGSYCHIVAGAFRFDLPWQLLEKISDSLFDRILAATSHMGLRYWDVFVLAGATDDHLTNISVRLYVVGRYEALGATWTRAATIPALYHGVALAPLDQRTYIHWYHITSMRNGEGFRVSTSNGSTEKNYALGISIVHVCCRLVDATDFANFSLVPFQYLMSATVVGEGGVASLGHGAHRRSMLTE